MLYSGLIHLNDNMQVEPQAWIRQAEATSTHTERMQIYQKVEQALVNDVTWLPLTRCRRHTLYNQK